MEQEELQYDVAAQVSCAVLRSISPSGEVNEQSALHVFKDCKTGRDVAKTCIDWFNKSYNTKLYAGSNRWEWLHKPIRLFGKDELRRPWFMRSGSVIDESKLSIYYKVQFELVVEQSV